MSCSRAQRTRRIGRRRRINVTHLSIRIFCDIRECYLFLDSRFFATYGNVTYFSIHVFLRHTGMLLISRFAFFCDIRECYSFLDSRFFATYGNVTHFSIHVFLRHTEMLCLVCVVFCYKSVLSIRVFLRHTGMLLVSRFTFFCDIRECYSFLDSRFFATYGNVTYFSIRVFLRHAGMLSFIVVSSCLHCCCRVSHFLFECYCFRFPVGGEGMRH